jgi:uncharacterized protein YcnI
MRLFTLFLLAMAVSATLAGPAAAHIQVTPKTAAPGDPVRFTLLVPNERDSSTVEVSLQIPPEVLPFSFNDPPGWRRTLDKKSDGSIEVVRWRGRLPREGFAEFAFLASTPERPGEISWKAIQTYSDGEETAWIGPPDSEEPASVTQVTADAPRQNAGGEGAGEDGATADTTAAPTAGSDSGGDDNRDWIAIALGGAGLLLGAVALLVALRRPRER